MQDNYTKLLLDFGQVPQHKRTKTFMEISGYSHYENKCSNILAFYLNPSNEHGLDNLVLNALVHLVDKDAPFFDKIKVCREYLTNGNGKLDLLIQTEKYVIGIENKIFHGLHNDLADYSKTIQSLCVNGQKSICIVLSLSKLKSSKDIDKMINSQFINVTYEQVFQNIKQNIGKHINSSNIGYVNHLTDFIKSIENLTPATMENKALWAFFNHHHQTVQELTKSFNEYKQFLFGKISQLQEIVPKSEYAPTADKQWIWKNEADRQCFVHDYTIYPNYELAVDVEISVSGWKIIILERKGRLIELCRDCDFLLKTFENYERKDNAIILQEFDVNADIDDVANALKKLLAGIELYKQQTK